jgi:hypothetical protein
MEYRDKIKIVNFKCSFDDVYIETDSDKAICIRGMYVRNQWLPKSALEIISVEPTELFHNDRPLKLWTVKVKEWFAKKNYITLKQVS